MPASAIRLGTVMAEAEFYHWVVSPFGGSRPSWPFRRQSEVSACTRAGTFAPQLEQSCVVPALREGNAYELFRCSVVELALSLQNGFERLMLTLRGEEAVTVGEEHRSRRVRVGKLMA